MKIRGTKLTVAQRKILKPIKLDLDSYLLKKIRVIDASFANKRLTKDLEKMELFELIDRNSGDIQLVGVKENGVVLNLGFQN